MSNNLLNSTDAIELGLEHHRSGQLQQADQIYREILQTDPDHADANHLLGVLAFQLGQHAIAAQLISKAVLKDGTKTQYLYNLGRVLQAQGKLDDASSMYREAISINSGYTDAHNSQGLLLLAQGKLEEALAAFQQALNLEPEFSEAHNNRGNTLEAQGKIEEALEAYLQAVTLQPGFIGAQSNLLLCLNYDASTDAQALFAAHQKWNDRHATALLDDAKSHINIPDPERRLRIGYVSADFCRHAVASFIEPLLASHDRDAFDVVCYSNVTKPDGVTEGLQKYVDKWRVIVGMPDKQFVKLIQEDGIDILVDLAGHTAGNRLLLFAHKPAPIQVTYLGYPSTCGLKAMDYRISDAWLDPEGLTDNFHSEELIRLPSGSLCFQPPIPCPKVSALPDISPGHVTFASFNNTAKISLKTIALWSKALQAIPEARLLMKSKSLDDKETIERLKNLFEQNGIAAHRLEFIGWVSSKEEHLALYNRVHIALDTFPYSGCTTTCEALWMGVPVIVLEGDESRSRMSLSVLRQAGLDDFIAESAEAYLDLAEELATDIGKLRRVRSNLRGRLKQSSLLDARIFTHEMESAYRNIWKRWCNI